MYLKLIISVEAVVPREQSGRGSIVSPYRVPTLLVPGKIQIADHLPEKINDLRSDGESQRTPVTTARFGIVKPANLPLENSGTWYRTSNVMIFRVALKLWVSQSRDSLPSATATSSLAYFTKSSSSYGS